MSDTDAQLDIIVIDATGNKTEEAVVPSKVNAAGIVSKLVELLALPGYGPDGQPLKYRFHHEQSGHQISDDEILTEAGIGQGDVLRLVAEITAGGEWREELPPITQDARSIADETRSLRF